MTAAAAAGHGHLRAESAGVVRELIAAHAIPVHRCAELIEALTGAKPSPGFVHGMIRRAAAAIAGANKLIRVLIIVAHVVCADETPIRVGPGPKTRRRYLLVACTKTQQKISGRLRSEQVTRHRYAIRGYLSTAARERRPWPPVVWWSSSRVPGPAAAPSRSPLSARCTAASRAAGTGEGRCRVPCSAAGARTTAGSRPG